MEVVNLALVFSRKYKWPEHYFSMQCSGNSWNILTTKQFFVSTIFFTNKNISFFNLCFDLFTIINKKSMSNQEQCSLCCSLPYFRVLLCTHYELLQCILTYCHKSKEIRVLQPIFQTMLILVTMIWINFVKNGNMIILEEKNKDEKQELF